MNINTAVQTVADKYGYGSRTAEIAGVTALIESGQSFEIVTHRLVQAGASPALAEDLVVEVLTLMDQPDPIYTQTYESETPFGTAQVTVEFDRQAAADTIRAFITAGSVHDTISGWGGGSEDEVTALLILAGLVDAPEPEPEPFNVRESVFDRLVAWAKRQGFHG
jgi:hypothetical protein